MAAAHHCPEHEPVIRAESLQHDAADVYAQRDDEQGEDGADAGDRQQMARNAVVGPNGRHLRRRGWSWSGHGAAVSMRVEGGGLLREVDESNWSRRGDGSSPLYGG